MDYVFWMELRMNSNFYLIIVFYNQGRERLLHSARWVFI
jgi:hypothetical protein